MLLFQPIPVKVELHQLLKGFLTQGLMSHMKGLSGFYESENSLAISNKEPEPALVGPLGHGKLLGCDFCYISSMLHYYMHYGFNKYRRRFNKLKMN